MMRKPRRKQTIEENVEYYCTKNNFQLTYEQKTQIKECFLLYENKFSSKHKLCEYISNFVKYDLKFWKQRLNKLLKINLKGVTKKKFLLLYGKDIARKKWGIYTNKQSEVNSYEYKKQKYNWTEDQFKNYNKSRSTTLDNMIKKYGEKEGENKYKNYIERQRYAGCSLDYFIDKYGKIDGIKKYQKICESKALTLDNFIKKYGEELGRKKYRDCYDSKPNLYSKSSQELFWKIKTENCYFAEHNKEFGLLSDTQYYFYDYVDTKLKKCIEYNGDYWHCNPRFYEFDYRTHYGYTAEEVWKKDDVKLDFMKSKGYDVMVIWESEYLENPSSIVKKIEDFLCDKD
jgi:hypothetical protein